MDVRNCASNVCMGVFHTNGLLGRSPGPKKRSYAREARAENREPKEGEPQKNGKK